MWHPHQPERTILWLSLSNYQRCLDVQQCCWDIYQHHICHCCQVCVFSPISPLPWAWDHPHFHKTGLLFLFLAPYSYLMKNSIHIIHILFMIKEHCLIPLFMTLHYSDKRSQLYYVPSSKQTKIIRTWSWFFIWTGITILLEVSTSPP